MKWLTAMMCLVATAASATDYYVDGAAGNNSNNGLATNTAWQTIYRGTRNFPYYIAAGDTLWIRGGIYRGNTNSIDIGTGLGNSGTAANPITVRAYPGETVIVTDVQNPYHGITLKDKSWWVFSDIIWSNNYQSAYLDTVTNFLFTNCTFRTMRPDADQLNYGYANLGFYNTCRSNKVFSCTFADWATIYTNTGSANQYQIAGTHISFGDETGDAPAYFNWVRGCTFANGGHDCFQLNTAYTLVESNVFHQEPYLATNATRGSMYYNFGNPRVEPNAIGKWGARGTKPGDAGTSQIDERNVFQYNQFYYASSPPDSAGAFGIELGTQRSIYRFNAVAFSHAAGIYFNTSGTTSRSSSNSVYGNVIFNNGLCYLYGNSNAYGFSYGLTMSTFEGRRTNNNVVNNIILGNYPKNVDATILTYQDFRGNLTNDAVNPLFVSTNGLGYVWNASNLPDFRLQAGSPCIDAGTWLTYAQSSGSGTSIVLTNSHYFTDGLGLIAGDRIQFQGSTATATVTSNNTALGVLHFSPSLSWNSGDGLSLAYNGIAPDQGMFESSVFPSPTVSMSGSLRMNGNATLTTDH